MILASKTLKNLKILRLKATKDYKFDFKSFVNMAPESFFRSKVRAKTENRILR
jgi:hypothetical protein